MTQIINTNFNYKWNIENGYPAKGVEKNNYKVFSTFSCGGGSTMGFKMAGYNSLGCLEIDKKMIECYRINHHPKYSFEEGIQTFKDRNDLPYELYNLDVLEGSPPCSSFSMAGARERDWGKSKKFREGQAEQVLDTLFFDFINLARRLKPKVVFTENVEGLLMGNARAYARDIIKAFDEAGYYIQYFTLNASDMGVPQKRRRVFFVGIRKDLADGLLSQVDLFTKQPILNLNFKNREIPYKEIEEKNCERRPLAPAALEKWERCKLGANPKVKSTGNTFGFLYRTHPDKVLPTIIGHSDIAHYYTPGVLTKKELCLAGSYPLDYNFLDNSPQYLIGMSVPPVMVACIANEIRKQWLDKI